MDRSDYRSGLAKLKVIEFWDRDYYRNSERDRLDRDAYRHRQEHRREIISEIPARRLAETRS